MKVSRYDSADRIEKAGITKDDQLCVFFAKDSTNSSKVSRFSLTIPLVQIRTNSQYYDVLVPTNDAGAVYVFPKTLDSSDRHKWWTFNVSGGQMRKNWPSLKIPDSKYIPVATALTDWERYPNPAVNPAVLHDKDFILLSNATQTVYVTRKTPIEFVYVDASTNQPYTIVTVAPTVISKLDRNPEYYAWLPLTVPVDIALSPIEIPIILMIAYGLYYGDM